MGGRRRAIAQVLDRSYLWILGGPALLVLLAVTGIPFLVAIGASFTDFSAIKPTWTLVGLENYQEALADPTVARALLNTLIMVGAILLTETVLGLGLALLLARTFRGMGFIRSL